MLHRDDTTSHPPPVQAPDARSSGGGGGQAAVLRDDLDNPPEFTPHSEPRTYRIDRDYLTGLHKTLAFLGHWWSSASAASGRHLSGLQAKIQRMTAGPRGDRSKL